MRIDRTDKTDNSRGDAILGKRWKYKSQNLPLVFLFGVFLFLAGASRVWAAAPAGEWWNTSYSYRQKLTVTTGATAPVNRYNGYTTLRTMDTATLVTATKMQADCDDLRVIWWNGSIWVELDRDIVNCNTVTTEVWFKLQADIAGDPGSDDNYYIYYDNSGAGAGPANKNNVYIYYDDFESYTIGSLPTGWTLMVGNASVQTDGGDKALRMDSVSTNTRVNLRYDITPAERDILVEADCNIDPSVGSDGYCGPGTRWSGTDETDETGYMGEIHYNGSGENVTQRYLGGAWANIGTADSQPVTRGTYYRVRLTTVGANPTTINMYRDGTPKADNPLTNSDIDVADMLGIDAYNGATNDYEFLDNYLARRFIEPEPTLAAGAETTNTIKISGSCKLVDQSTNCADGRTVRVAVNAMLQVQSTTTSAGAWTISGVTAPLTGNVITVYIEGAPLDTDEAVAVTKYDGTGDITGIELIEEHLTIGSDDNQTISNADLNQFDNAIGGEDVFHDVNDGTNDLTVDITTFLTAEELYIKAGNIYQPDSGSSGNVTTHDLEINGSLTADGNTLTLTGSWDNNSIFTAGTSTVTLNGANQSLTGSTTFNHFTKTEASNDATDVTLTFDNTATQTINGIFTLDGLDADDRINLVSDSPGTRWSVVLGASAVKIIDFIDVTDSDASASALIPILPISSVDSGNTISWFDLGKLIKRAFLSSDSSAIADTSTLPKGTLVKYLIYLNNPGQAISDVSVRDVLDAAFLYQGVSETGTSSLKVNNTTAACALVNCTAGEESTIFSDVDATGVKTEGADGDAISISGVTIDAGDQNAANATVNLLANTVWALSFEVKMQ